MRTAPVIAAPPRKARPVQEWPAVIPSMRTWWAGYRCMMCQTAYTPDDKRLRYWEDIDGVFCEDCVAIIPQELFCLPAHPVRLVVDLDAAHANNAMLKRVVSSLLSYPGQGALVVIAEGRRLTWPKDPIAVTVESAARACWMVGVGNVCVE